MIYADNAATTPLDQDSFEAMKPFLLEQYGNASQPYSFAREPRTALKWARETIADCIGAKPEEIYFTSGGTESDNWAIKSSSLKRPILTSQIEHHAILNACAAMEHLGVNVRYLPVNCYGTVQTETLEAAMDCKPRLVSIMLVNNEIGSIEPIASLANIAHKYGALFHTDAVQAVGHIPIDVNSLGIDMLSASAHKFNGPKGVGFLYIRKKIPLPEYIHGGKQERNHRAGTENVPGIAGMGKAAEIAFTTREYREKEIQQLRDYLIQRLQREIPYCRLNGSLANRLPGNCNISFQFIEGNELLLLLDEKNICASAASACSTGDTSPSHVLTAMGIPEKLARGTLRLTIGYQNTQEEIDYTVSSRKTAGKCRRLSKIQRNFPLQYNVKYSIINNGSF